MRTDYLRMDGLYVESRKMIQMNLFPREEERHKDREQSYGHRGVRTGGMN